jgi:hypothetical protein
MTRTTSSASLSDYGIAFGRSFPLRKLRKFNIEERPLPFIASIRTRSATSHQKRSAHRDDSGEGVSGLPSGFASPGRLTAGDESENAEQGEQNTTTSDYQFHPQVLLQVNQWSANFPHSASLTLSHVHRQRSGVFRQRMPDSGCTVKLLTCNVHREPGQGHYEKTRIGIRESSDISETRSRCYRRRDGSVNCPRSSVRQRRQPSAIRPSARLR